MGWRDGKVTALRLPAESAAAARAALLRKLPDAQERKADRDMARVRAAIVRYFAGSHETFDEVAVDLGRQEPFFTRVYDHVRALRWGETSSYGEVARALNATPEAARTVGQAMARNPVPLIVPCHRVLAAWGRIGGFSAPGGSDAKARMLMLERSARNEPQGAFDF